MAPESKPFLAAAILNDGKIVSLGTAYKYWEALLRP